MANEILTDEQLDNVAGVFAAHGINMEYNGKFLEANVYTYQGKTISREQAWNIVDGK